ncbi:hypothetical protein [Brachyspira pulli]|uniref:hypothetical protein n=1 Tax=Brachyspira pulli TaxID=310721 RepID=UPI003006F523
MFKITKDILKKDLLENTQYSKEAAEFLSGFLLNKNNHPTIDIFFAYEGELKEITGISLLHDCIEDTFFEIKKKDICSFIKKRGKHFNVNNIIYESNDIIIYIY